ncbi:MAG TPA: hypothetical protein VGV62_14280 [Xanthobacteraceae bacterium]|nr:hypothetical protein [Xanthobacteraceae bacterium]
MRLLARDGNDKLGDGEVADNRLLRGKSSAAVVPMENDIVGEHCRQLGGVAAARGVVEASQQSPMTLAIDGETRPLLDNVGAGATI